VPDGDLLPTVGAHDGGEEFVAAEFEFHGVSLSYFSIHWYTVRLIKRARCRQSLYRFHCSLVGCFIPMGWGC
jgi:hypothetical protein